MLKSVTEKIDKNTVLITSSQQKHFEKISTHDTKMIGPKAHSSSELILVMKKLK